MVIATNGDAAEVGDVDAYAALANDYPHIDSDLWHVRLNGLDFDNMSLVRRIIEETPNQIFIDAALKGEIKLAKAKTVQPLWWGTRASI